MQRAILHVAGHHFLFQQGVCKIKRFGSRATVEDARVSHGVQCLFCVAAGASRGTFLAVLRGDLGPAGAPRGYSVSGGASGGRNDSVVPCKGDLMHPPPPHVFYR